MSLSALAVYGVFFAVLAAATYFVKSRRLYFYFLTILSASVAFFTYRVAALSCDDFWKSSGCTDNIEGIAGLWLMLVFFVCMIIGRDVRECRERAKRKSDEQASCCRKNR